MTTLLCQQSRMRKLQEQLCHVGDAAGVKLRIVIAASGVSTSVMIFVSNSIRNCCNSTSHPPGHIKHQWEKCPNYTFTWSSTDWKSDTMAVWKSWKEKQKKIQLSLIKMYFLSSVQTFCPTGPQCSNYTTITTAAFSYKYLPVAARLYGRLLLQLYSLWHFTPAHPPVSRDELAMRATAV